VQTVAHIPHAPKAQVKFTTQRYYLPSGRLIQRTDDATDWGVDPTPGFYVPMTDREQFDAFLKRRDWDILRKDAAAAAGDPSHPAPPEQHWSDANWIRDQALDKQLAAALDAVQTRVASGEWKPVSEIKDEHGTLQVTELHDLQKARKQLGLEFARIEKRMSALQKQAEIGQKAPERVELWSDELDLTGGRVDVVDKDGKTVAKLKITGRDIERWLLNADVEPIKDDSTSSTGTPPPTSGPTP
jgi:hypothetical protein